MNIKEYIESGIVTTYVLGLTTEAEQKEFEELCTQYPELIEAKTFFELSLEDQLMREAVAVPEGLKKRVLNSVNNQDMMIPQREFKKPLRVLNIWKMVAAACMLLLIGSIYFTYSFREKYQELLIKDTEFNSLKESSKANPFIAIDSIVKNPSIKWSAMLDPKDSSHCMAHIYWDSVSTNTFLLVGNIPETVPDKQFQLWALQDDQPVSLGIFDAKRQGQLVQMKNVQKVKMFIITLEQKGGSSAPSMDGMYAVGKL